MCVCLRLLHKCNVYVFIMFLPIDLCVCLYSIFRQKLYGKSTKYTKLLILWHSKRKRNKWKYNIAINTLVLSFCLHFFVSLFVNKVGNWVCILCMVFSPLFPNDVTSLRYSHFRIPSVQQYVASCGFRPHYMLQVVFE